MKPTRREFVGGALGAGLFSLPVLADQERRSRLWPIIRADAALAAYWPLDGDLRDAAGRAALRAVGGPPRFVEGPAGGEAVLLGDGRFLTTDAAGHLDLEATSVELLFQLTRPITADYNPCLIAKRASGGDARFSVHVDRRSMIIAVWNGQRVFQFTPQSGPLEVGRWHHLVVTWRDRDLRLYLDGLPAAGSGWFNAAAKGLPLQIGSSTPEGRELCDCAVDEVAVYARVLSGEEIMHRVEAVGWAERSKAVLAERRRLAAERRRRDERKLRQLMADPRLLAAGEPRVYRGEHLEAISLPLGPLGGGAIQLNGKAELAVWQIFGNFRYARLPHTFFAVRAKPQDGRPVVRALQTASVGPLAGLASLTFRGEYPFGRFDFQDDGFPLAVQLEALHPFIPLNAKDSSLPAVLLRVTLENRSSAPVEAAVLGSLQNAAGYDGQTPIDGRRFAGYGGNVNRVLNEGGATLLHCARTPGGQAGDGGRGGELVLACFDPEATGAASWDSLEELQADFAQDGALSGPREAGPTEPGETVDGALAVRRPLAPGQRESLEFALLWHVPDVRHGNARGWSHAGHMYANWWPDALAAARYLAGERERLIAQTRLFHDSLYASNLPRWLIDRMIGQAAVLASKTCFWAADGYFGGWEGCNATSGCCFGNCAHVWHYAQLHARLFPEIGRRMREQALGAMDAAGGIPFRQPSGKTACDGQCGEILGAYREHLCSPDDRWLRRQWPRIRAAMRYVIATWDPDEDGVLAGPQHNTLDGELGGSSSWLGSLYLAALAAVERMAETVGDRATAERCRRIRRSGARTQDETLFNGEYYIQIPDPTPREDYNNGCHIDQVLGEWWAAQLGLERCYPVEHVRSALTSLLRYNFRGDFHGVVQRPRKFVDDDDAGLQMICWPKGDRPPRHMRYADEVMSGFEYSAAVAMLQHGLLHEGLAVLLAAADRYDGRLRTGLAGEGQGRSAWGYSGNPFGDDECGKFYARPMSIWSALLALQGFLYDGPAAKIGFRPVWRPEDHASLFTAAEGWGVFRQQRRQGRQTSRIDLAYGRLRVAELELELPQGVAAADVQLAAAAEHAIEGDRLRLRLKRPVVLEAPDSLEVVVRWSAD